jgi:hypothetical protein
MNEYCDIDYIKPDGAKTSVRVYGYMEDNEFRANTVKALSLDNATSRWVEGDDISELLMVDIYTDICEIAEHEYADAKKDTMIDRDIALSLEAK